MMRKWILAFAILFSCIVNSFALDWEDTTSPRYGESISTVQAIGGYHYRIKMSGRLMRKQSGTTHYLYITINDVPLAYREAVAQTFEQYVGAPSERTTSQSTVAHHDQHDRHDRYDQHDASNRSDNRRSDRHDRYDRHIDRHDARRYDQHDASSFRDREVEYRVHTRGSYAPTVVATNNSTITVHVHPISASMAMAALAENSRLMQQVIAANSARSQAEAELRVEQNKPKVRTVEKIVYVPKRVVVRRPKLVVLLCTNWKCGSKFTDQFGRRWIRMLGPAKSYRSRMYGYYGHDAHGRLTFTVGSTVFVDP